MAGKSRIEQIEELLAQDPNDGSMHYFLGMEYTSAGDDAQALRCYEQAIAVDAGYVPAYQQAGQTLAKLNRLAEARTLWQRGIEQARRQGNMHAAEEMQGFLANLD